MILTLSLFYDLGAQDYGERMSPIRHFFHSPANSVFVPFGMKEIAMYSVTMPNDSKKTTIMLPPKRPWQISNGHRSHRGGSCTHGDRRQRRIRTRADQRRAAVEE